MVHREWPNRTAIPVEDERFPAGKVPVIPNGVDTDRFAPLPEMMAFRQSLGIGPTTR